MTPPHAGGLRALGAGNEQPSSDTAGETSAPDLTETRTVYFALPNSIVEWQQGTMDHSAGDPLRLLGGKKETPYCSLACEFLGLGETAFA